MLETALVQYRFLQAFGEGLLADIDPADAFTAVCPGGNHPAWILGHLAYGGLGFIGLLGGDAPEAESVGGRFGIGSVPEPSGEDFDQLLAQWRDVHTRVEAVAASANPEQLAAPSPHELTAPHLPTVGDFAAFLLTGHEALHLGQLSAWRRARGGKPLR